VSPAADFLVGLAKAVSTMSLYADDHPSRMRAVDGAHDAIRRLQEETARPHFTFLGDEIVYGDRPLRELRRWNWGAKLARAGIQRLEFTGPVEREDLDHFLETVHARLAGPGVETAEARPSRPTNIRWGQVTVEGIEDEADGEVDGGRPLRTATLGFDLKEEYDATGWLHRELKEERRLHMLEAESLVRSLSVAMHGDQAFLIPLVRLKRFDQYTTTHAMNVSVLAMALSEFIGLAPDDVRAFGIAGLLHDLGKVAVPEEILNKPGKLTDEERAVMNRHPEDGARMILEAEEHLDLAAVVAYEHHIRIDGAGYPTFRRPRRSHQASELVHVCDVFDALRTHRPYRDAWAQDRILDYIEEGAGTEFQRDVANAFVRMMRQWSDRVATVEDPEEDLPIGASEEEPAGRPADEADEGDEGEEGDEGDDVRPVDGADDVGGSGGSASGEAP